MSSRRGPRLRVLVAAGLVVTLLVAGLAGLLASGAPDGLERAAIDHGLTDEQKAHRTDGSPLAGYETSGVDGPLSGGLAALAGIGVTFVLAAGMAGLLRRRKRAAGASAEAFAGPATPAPRPSGRARVRRMGRPEDRRGANLRPDARPDDREGGRSAGEDG